MDPKEEAGVGGAMHHDPNAHPWGEPLYSDESFVVHRESTGNVHLFTFETRELMLDADPFSPLFRHFLNDTSDRPSCQARTIAYDRPSLLVVEILEYLLRIHCHIYHHCAQLLLGCNSSRFAGASLVPIVFVPHYTYSSDEVLHLRRIGVGMVAICTR